MEKAICDGKVSEKRFQNRYFVFTPNGLFGDLIGIHLRLLINITVIKKIGARENSDQPSRADISKYVYSEISPDFYFFKGTKHKKVLNVKSVQDLLNN